MQAFIRAAILLLMIGHSPAHAFSSKFLKKVIHQPGRAIEDIVTVPVDIVKSAVEDPIGAVVNPERLISEALGVPTVSSLLGLPTVADLQEFVLKNPEAALTLIERPGDAPFIPIANAIVSARNAALTAGTRPIPPEIREKLKVWYSDEILDSIRWSAHPALYEGLVQNFAFATDHTAITLLNVIVFKDESGAKNLPLWAHEVLHVEQYRSLGVFEFAKKLTVEGLGMGSEIEGPAYLREDGARVRFSSSQTIAIPPDAWPQRSLIYDIVSKQQVDLGDATIEESEEDSPASEKALVTITPSPKKRKPSEAELELLDLWEDEYCEPTGNEYQNPLRTPSDVCPSIADEVEAVKAALKSPCIPRDPSVQFQNPLTTCPAPIWSSPSASFAGVGAALCVTSVGTCVMSQATPKGSFCLCQSGFYSFAGYTN